MGQLKKSVVCLLLVSAFFVTISTSGFDFITNQYVYYRFLEDANLAYVVSRANDYEKTSLLVLNQTTHNHLTDPHDDVQAKTANLLALMSFLSLGCSVFAVVAVGSISDRYGRLSSMALVLLGLGLKHIIIAFVILLRWDVRVLIGASVICGILGGGFVAFLIQISVCFADMTEVPDQECSNPQDSQSHRTNRQTTMERDRLILFGVFDATRVFSAALGSGLIGAAIDHLGFVTSALGSLTFYCVPVVLIWFVPETLRPIPNVTVRINPAPASVEQAPRQTKSVDPNPSSETVQTAVHPSLWSVIRSGHPTTLLVSLVLFLFSVVILSESQYSFLYLMSAPFYWSVEAVGLYSGVGNVILAIASLVLTLVTAWSMRIAPTITTTAVSTRSSISGSQVALIQAEDSLAPDVVDTRTLAHQLSTSLDPSASPETLRSQVLLSRLRMLIYISVGYSMIILSKLILGSASLLPSPQCTVAAVISLIVGLVRAAVVPTLKSFLSSLHPANIQGRLFSLVGIAEYAGLLVGMPSLSAFYAATVSSFAGSVFFLSASLAFVSLAMVLFMVYSVARELMVLNRAIFTTPVVVLST